jgi:hypothetical protein
MKHSLKIREIFAAIIMLTASGFSVADMLPPDSVIAPCVRNVQIEPITKTVIHMTPFRGVNLIFPFQLFDDKTVYSMSSDKMWKFERASGTNTIPIYFNEFKDGYWGNVNDLTIAVEGLTFSLSIVADPDLTQHCSNIVFDLSPEMKAKMDAKRKEAYEVALKQKYEEKMKQLDVEAENKALLLVGELANTRPDSERINEEDALKLAHGDELVAYVKKIVTYRKFSNVLFELESSGRKDIYVQGIEFFRLEGESKTPIRGYVDYVAKMKDGAVQSLVFTSLDMVPVTGAMMIVKTDAGEVIVKW